MLFGGLAYGIRPDLPPNLARAVWLGTRLMTDTSPFAPEGATAIPLRVLRRSSGFRFDWEIAEGLQFQRANNIPFVKVNATLITSTRRHDYSYGMREPNACRSGWGPGAPHRSPREFDDLSDAEFDELIAQVLEEHVDRAIDYFAAGGFFDEVFGDGTATARTLARNSCARLTRHLLLECGMDDDLAEQIEQRIFSIDVNAPSVDRQQGSERALDRTLVPVE
jgi:hypothetical protein